MCGRATLTASPEDLPDMLGIPDLVVPPAFAGHDARPLTPRYNIAPSQSIAVVRARPAGSGRLEKRLEMLRWGLAARARPGLVVNARAEGLLSRPEFRDRARAHRCLVVVDGFYEWRAEGRAKVPFRAKKPDGRAFALAAIWDHTGDTEGDPDACVVLTVGARGAVAELHGRMPLVLAPAAFDAWLDPACDSYDVLRPLLRAPESSDLVIVPASPRVNSPANDDAACLIAPSGEAAPGEPPGAHDALGPLFARR
jgi:putative SOS response-associated peptidase YedK